MNLSGGAGSRGVVLLLRLPGGALAESSDDEPHRVDLRHHSAANGEDHELPEKAVLSLVNQFAMSAGKRWRRLRGFRHLADVFTDVRFIDGVN